MTHLAIADSIQIARDEISSRIEQTEDINKKFKNSFSGYTENTGEQKAAVFFLALFVIGLLIFSPFIVDRFVPEYSEEWIYTLSITALYSICIYASLFMLNIIIRLKRIAKLDGYISNVNQIKDMMTANLASVDKAISELESVILQKNISITPDKNLDYEIENYKKKAETYLESGDGALDLLIEFAYWISSAIFGIAFVAVTGEYAAELVEYTFNVDIYPYLYPIIAFILFVIINCRLAKKSSEYKLRSYVLSLLSCPAAIPAVWILCGIIYIIIHIIAIVIAGSLIIGFFIAIFNS